MRVLYDGRLQVSYGQAYLEAGDDHLDFDASFEGQVNGLAGARSPARVVLVVGLHTGDVGMRVVLHDVAPPVGPDWEEVVEVSFAPSWPETALTGCLADTACSFTLDQPTYRVRFSGRGMDAGRAADVVMAEEPLVDSYELALWPAPEAPDAVLRVGSDIARYWHRRRDPAVARAERVESLWRDVPPVEAMVDLWNAPQLVELDRSLAEALAAAAPGVQRAVAYHAAQAACERTGIAQVEWVGDALRALRTDEVLPALFHDPDALYERLDTDAPSPTGEPSGTNGWPGPAPTGHALATALGAALTDPLDAVVTTLLDAHRVAVHDAADESAASAAFLREVREVLLRLEVELTTQHGAGPVPDLRPPFVAPDPLDEVPEGVEPSDHFTQVHLWGGELPDARLVEVGAWPWASLDLVLAESLAAADPRTQRAVAVWAARRACEGAGLTRIAEVADALRALDRGEDLPSVFQQEGGEWCLLGDDDLAETVVFDGAENCSRRHFALPVVRHAADRDPLRAATETLWTAACSFGDDQRREVVSEAARLFHLQSSL